MRRRHKAALAVAHVLVPLAACGPATVAAPTAREASSTTSPEAALPPTSVVEPVTEALSLGATGSVGSTPTAAAPPLEPPAGRGPATNSIANGPLPVNVAETLACIRSRESDAAGGYQAVNPNGHYGAYQADEDFWLTNGGDPSYSGHIQDAPPTMQDDVAANGLAARGTQPWGGVC